MTRNYTFSMTKSGGRPRSVPIRLRYFFLFATVFGGSLLLISFNSRIDFFLLNNGPSNAFWDSNHYKIVNSEESFTINTEGCTIPGLHPFDESIRKFSDLPDSAEVCNNANQSLLQNNKTHIWIVSENMQYYNIPDEDNITCCYRGFYRPAAIADINANDIDERIQYGRCTDFSDNIEIENEFVKVTCKYKYKIIYEQFFLTARKKSPVLFTEDTIGAEPNGSKYNVLIMGIDAVSRLNFYRTMPKTLNYLKKKGAIEFLGYNKVGDNTFPNLTPMLLGIKYTDLKNTCWPNSRASFDHCPFIWNWFKDVGYYTAFGEDNAGLGTFNYGKLGFTGTPTDYYLHTFMYESELHVGNQKDFNTYICIGDKYLYKVLLDYIEGLTLELRSDNFFGFFWEATMTHDYLHYPKIMDNDYERFLEKLDNNKYLDQTILILLSDHGIRWGDIRFTKQGRLEERLPLFHILLPPSFRETYTLAYNNMKINRRRLITPFDVHATLLDLVNLNELDNERIRQRSNEYYASDRSISLFLPVPTNRTCKMAEIADHWCTCHKSHRISTESIEGQEAALHLEQHLNLLLHDYPQCAQLQVTEIIEMIQMDAGTPDQGEVGWEEFMVVVRTQPGGAVFEATLRHDYDEWVLAGTISRLNLYGEQSRCVHHYQLKLYCYCQ